MFFFHNTMAPYHIFSVIFLTTSEQNYAYHLFYCFTLIVFLISKLNVITLV